MRIRGLTIGGKIFRHHVAKTFCVPILAYHHPKSTTWRWFIQAFRYRASSGCRHGFLRVRRQVGGQSFTGLDLFWFCCIQFGYQRRTKFDRRHDLFNDWLNVHRRKAGSA